MPIRTFWCHGCNQNINYEIPASGGASGAGIMDNKTYCYPCCGKHDSQNMRRGVNMVLYLGKNEVQNWCGSLKFVIDRQSKSRHNFGIERRDVWFTDEHGQKWHGINIGDSQLLRCRRLKSDKPCTLIEGLRAGVHDNPGDFDRRLILADALEDEGGLKEAEKQRQLVAFMNHIRQRIACIVTDGRAYWKIVQGDWKSRNAYGFVRMEDGGIYRAKTFDKVWPGVCGNLDYSPRWRLICNATGIHQAI